jgi:hypothetical protein
VSDGNERILDRLTVVESELRDIRAEQKGIRSYIGARAGETGTLMQHLLSLGVLGIAILLLAVIIGGPAWMLYQACTGAAPFQRADPL